MKREVVGYTHNGVPRKVVATGDHPDIGIRVLGVDGVPRTPMNRTRYHVELLCCGRETTVSHITLMKRANCGIALCVACTALQVAAREYKTPETPVGPLTQRWLNLVEEVA